MMESLLAGWEPLIGSPEGGSSLSFKEQLSLEAQFHPSWPIRLTLHRWQQLIASGHGSAQVFSFLPWAAPPWELTLDDFYQLLHGLAQQHPQAFPWGSTLRWGCVAGFTVVATPGSLSTHEMLVSLLPIIGLLSELWSWGAWKRLSVILHWWQRSPSTWSELNTQGIPEPIFLRSNADKQLWAKMWAIEPELMATARRFTAYYKLLKKRQHQRARQFWALSLDISTLWLFTQLSNTLLQGLYHAS